jgi:hypothetical protein
VGSTLKQRAPRAEVIPMRRSKGVRALILLALICVPALSGCAGTETQPASAEAHGVVVGGLVEQLKEEGSAGEVKELAEQQLGPEEREEAHEAIEQREEEATQEQEGEEEEEDGQAS